MSDEDRFLIVACIPTYNEERGIASVVVQAMRSVDRVVVCDDGSGDLTAVRICFYWMDWDSGTS